LLSQRDEDLSELVAEARQEAEARVRAMLVDAFTDALLEQVHDVLEQAEAPSTVPAPPPVDTPSPVQAPPPVDTPSSVEAPPTPQPASTAAPPSSQLGWYVYCVVGDDHNFAPRELGGIDSDHPVFMLRQGDVAAIVSRVPLADFGEEPLRTHLSDMEWLERTARRHETVLEEVARGGTPIPMRLCSIYRDEAGVRDMLGRESDGLRQALAHLRGKAEWGVKAFADAEAVEAAPSAEDPALGPGDGAAYMESRLTQRRRREDADAQLEEACDALHAALSAVAAEAVVSSPQRPEVSGRDLPMVFNASYLVADTAAGAFHRELTRRGDELASLGIELETTGPWPPYNFVPGAIGAAW
jgi:hypothetical protein